MFELEIPTKAKLTDVEVLSQKNRKPEDNPGAKLSFEAQLANDWLSVLDGHLLGVLYTKHGNPAPQSQSQLDGVPVVSDLPNLTAVGQRMGTIHWDQKLTGYTMALQFGTGRKESNIESSDCEVLNLRITPNEGGTIDVKFSIEAPNISDAQWGKLARLKGREVDVAALGPDPSTQTDIEDAKKTEGVPS
jgi:hypothetical protein